MKGFKSTSTNPYTYTQDGVWKKGQYTFQAVVLSDSGYAFAFQRADTTWQTVDLSWQVKEGSYSKIQWTFTLEVDAVAFRLIANTVTGETTVLQPMLEKGSNGSTPIAHEEDLRGMDGDNHEFIFTRNTTGIAPDTPLSTQEDDYVPEDWTDNAQGVTSEIPFEFVSMRERKNGVWLDFSPPSLWAKWGEDGLSVNLLVEGHYKSHWEGTTKVVEIVGGVDVGGNEVVKVSAVFRKGGENIAATVSHSRGFQWYVNGVHLTAFDNQPFITLDETYGDGFADYVVLSCLVNSIREEERREIINISEGMDGIGEEFIFKANNSDTEPPVLPQTTDVGYQNDDYHGDWSDNPVAPTELNQFVWTAKRKKVGGIWEAFGTPSIWTKWVRDGEDGADAVAPIIIDGFWAFWDDTLQDYEKSSFSAVGDDGHSPYVGANGNWYQWVSESGVYGDTGIKAEGEDGSSAIIDYIFYLATSASSGVTVYTDGWKQDPSQTPLTPINKYLWSYTSYKYTNGGGYYNTIPAIIGVYGDKGAPGSDGEDGHSPYISGTTGTWWRWDDALGQYVNTGYSPVGSDGRIPYPAGYYDDNKWYRREAEYAPYVQYEGALYLLIKDTPNAGIATSNTTYWKAFNNWQAVFVDSLVAKFAQIGGAVFTGDTTQTASGIRGRLISEKGVDGTANFKNYTGDSGTWQPKLMLDFLNGRAKIEGEVAATSGKIGDFTIQDGWLTAINYHMMQTPGGELVQVTSTIQLTPSGIKMYNSYGGTIDHPQVVSWNTEVTAGGVKVGSMELRRDGLYRDGVFVI